MSQTPLESEIRDLIERVHRLSRETRALSRGSQASFRGVELTDGPVTYYDEDGTERLQVGPQADGTFGVQVVNSPPPPQPTSPDLEPVPSGIKIKWDGTFVDGNWPADLVRVEIHVNDVPDYIPLDVTQRSEFISPTGGEWVYRTTTGAGNQYIKLVAVNSAGVESVPSDEVASVAGLIDAETDGDVPPKILAVTTTGGIRAIGLSWPEVVNADPVQYKIYGATATGFANDADHYIGVAVGNRITVYRVWDAVVGDMVPVVPGTDYYFRVVASDGDGDGLPSDEATGSPIQITGPDVAAESITGDHIFGNTISADKFEAVLAMVSEIILSDRMSLRPTDTDPDPLINNSGLLVNLLNGGKIHLPSDGSAAEFLKVVARFTQAVVEDNLQILGANNRVGGALTLDKNIPPPDVKPEVTSVQDPDTVLGASAAYVGLGDNGTYFQRGYHSAYNSSTGVSTLQVRNINKVTGADTLAYSVVLDWYNVVLDTGGAHPAGGGPAPTPTLASFHSTATHAVATFYTPAYTTWYLDEVTLQKVYTTTPARYWIVVINNATGAITHTSVWAGAVANYYNPAIFTDGTNIWVGASAKANGTLNVYKYGMTMGAIISSITTTAYTSRAMTGLYVGNADYGSLRYLMTFGGALPGASGVVVHDGTNFKPTEDWAGPASEGLTGLIYSGGRFYAATTGAKIRRFSTVKVDTARAVKYTWHNIAGNIKSTASPVNNTFTQNARLWMQVTTDAIPASSDVQAPDSVLIYVDAHEQAAPAAGDTIEVYEVPTVVGGDSPAVDGFLAISTYGRVASEGLATDGLASIDLRGTGDGRVGPYHWDVTGELPAGNIYKTTAQSSGTASVIANMNGLRKVSGGVTHYTTTGMLRIPRDGWYMVAGNVNWAASTSSARRIAGIATNTDGSATTFSAMTGIAIASAQDTANISGIVGGTLLYLTAGTYVGVWVNSSVSYALEVGAAYNCHLSVAYQGSA